MDEARLDAIEARLRQVEDELAITRLVASYGPLVDAGEADAVAGLWTEDGDYDVEGWHMSDREQVRAMVRSDAHQHLITTGCCHFLGPAWVSVDGDEATAVCESLLVRHKEGRFEVRRAGANRMLLRRTPDGWQVAHRTTRALTGSAEARDLLGARR